jgi:hypothetical protein
VPAALPAKDRWLDSSPFLPACNSASRSPAFSASTLALTSASQTLRFPIPYSLFFEPCFHRSQKGHNYLQKHAKIGQKTPIFECFCQAGAGHYRKISTPTQQLSSKTEIALFFKNRGRFSIL